MEYYEEQLDLNKARITQLEKEVVILEENLTTAIDHLKETQRFLFKLAQNQAELAKKIASWPFIVTNSRGENKT